MRRISKMRKPFRLRGRTKRQRIDIHVSRAGRPNSTSSTAMVLNGIGLAWVPMSLVVREIKSGKLRDLSKIYGDVTLKISLYARPEGNLNKTVVNGLTRLRGQ